MEQVIRCSSLVRLRLVPRNKQVGNTPGSLLLIF